jgi:uncharacterized membrane protein
MLETIVIFGGLGYLLVLAVLGYVALLAVIKKRLKDENIQKFVSVLVITLHYIMGICGVMFAAFFFRDYTGSGELPGSLLFTSIVILGLILVFYVLNYLNKNIEWK